MAALEPEAPFTMSFPSVRGEIETACSRVENYLAELGMANERFEILLSLREALNNAVIHGNEEDPDKSVELTLTRDRDGLSFTVQDQGPGFDWRRSMARPVDARACSGRGLAILETYLTNLTFNEIGNKLMARFKISGDTDMADNAQETTLIVDKPIVASTIDELRQKFTDRIELHPESLTLDLAAVDMIDSMGLGLLVATHNSLLKRGCRLQLVNVSPDVYKLMTTMRLHKHFEIQKSE